jgi:DNA-binding response OmpR family regulator
MRMAIELGATRCLRKPFTPAALLAVIKDCLADTVELHGQLTGDSESSS